MAQECPGFDRGGMSRQQLTMLLARYAVRANLTPVVRFDPWPFRGSVQRFGDRLTVVVDSRLEHEQRLATLAHEVGHVALGHYALEEGCWYFTDSEGMNEWEWEADLFARIALRSPGVPLASHLAYL